jgi:very-short-patch-repair endonuclease
MPEFSTRPDFTYDQTKALVYVDGPHHKQDATKAMDEAKRRAVRDAGFRVVVFTENSADWLAVFAKFSFVFGKGTA